MTSTGLACIAFNLSYYIYVTALGRNILQVLYIRLGWSMGSTMGRWGVQGVFRILLLYIPVRLEGVFLYCCGHVTHATASAVSVKDFTRNTASGWVERYLPCDIRTRTGQECRREGRPRNNYTNTDIYSYTAVVRRTLFFGNRRSTIKRVI